MIEDGVSILETDANSVKGTPSFSSAVKTLALMETLATLNGPIGVSDLAYQSYHVSQQTFRGLSVYAAAALLYILLSLPIAWLSRWADVQLRSRVSR